MATQKNIIIFLASVRPYRFADRPLALVKFAIEARGMKVTVFDPMEMQFQLITTPIHFMKDPTVEAPAWLQDANQQIVDADGFVIISTEYNCGIPPALANMLDHFPPGSFYHRPCGLVTYTCGHSGGARVLTLLRIFVAEFGMYPLPNHVVIPMVDKSLAEDGQDRDGRFIKKVEKQVYELEWLADAICNHKKIAKPSDYGFVYRSFDDPSKVKAASAVDVGAGIHTKSS